jgi:type IV secretory pathway VirB9-like protein
VIERNGFKKFLEEIQDEILGKTRSRDVTAWNMISKKHITMLKSLESNPDATLSSIFCSWKNEDLS